MKKIIFTDKAPAPIGPYSQAVLAGNTLYISGQIAIDPASGNLVAARSLVDGAAKGKKLTTLVSTATTPKTVQIRMSLFSPQFNWTNNPNSASYSASRRPSRIAMPSEATPWCLAHAVVGFLTS